MKSQKQREEKNLMKKSFKTIFMERDETLLVCKNMRDAFLRLILRKYVGNWLYLRPFSKFKKKNSFQVSLTKIQLTKISLNFKTSCRNLKSEVWEQNCVWLLYYFSFERNYDVLKSESPCILLNKNQNFNKNETEPKIENPTHSFRETNLNNAS